MLYLFLMLTVVMAKVMHQPFGGLVRTDTTLVSSVLRQCGLFLGNPPVHLLQTGSGGPTLGQERDPTTIRDSRRLASERSNVDVTGGPDAG